MPFKDPEKRKEYYKKYYRTPAGKKSHTINNWKLRGLIHDNYSELYEHYINTNECDVCKKVFNDRFDRCMDHDHVSGLFRQILCNNCNSMDNWKNKIKLG
jgi:hypothetical protein